MIPRGGPPGPRRRGSAALLMLLLAASAWLYGALLVLYPKAFRRRYSEEMRQDFRELMLEGLEEGGATELVRVWVATLSVFAAIDVLVFVLALVGSPWLAR